MKKFFPVFSALVLVLLSSACKSESSQVDADWLPYVDNIPTAYWNVRGILYNPEKNSLNPADPDSGLRNHLLVASLAGLASKGLKEGVNDIAVWYGSPIESEGQLNSRLALEEMGAKSLGEVSALELALKGEDEEGSLRKLFKGYVLVDLENNLESGTVASVASHVYDALIVDVQFKELFDNAGFEMVYDAREKSTQDSWKEFKDKCDNSALIFMHVNTAELKDIAIANRLFCINVNKVYNTKEFGTNWDTFCEVLEWLKPNSPCYGADHGNDEGEMDEIISLYGNHWVPFDWGYNTTVTSVCYPSRQESVKYEPFNAKGKEPVSDKKYVSYYMSDGDNVQWVMGGFNPQWYADEFTGKTKMSYGLCATNLSMIGPAHLSYLFDHKNPQSSIFERGSYYFLDILGQKKDREAILSDMAAKQAKTMKAQGLKLLGTVTRGKADSEEAVRGYQALIDANDELEGIIAIAYSPYADSSQDIIWLKNRRGEDIPVMMTTYCIWNKETRNDPDEGTPAYIAHRIKEDGRKFTSVCVHCWSSFTDIGDSEDELAEDFYEGKALVTKTECADMCTRRLGSDYEICMLEELFWRMREEHKRQAGI